jgi:hypothetical protein
VARFLGPAVPPRSSASSACSRVDGGSGWSSHRGLASARDSAAAPGPSLQRLQASSPSRRSCGSGPQSRLPAGSPRAPGCLAGSEAAERRAAVRRRASCAPPTSPTPWR